jgi:hypothetical protein
MVDMAALVVAVVAISPGFLASLAVTEVLEAVVGARIPAPRFFRFTRARAALSAAVPTPTTVVAAER